MVSERILFNLPPVTGREIKYIGDAIERRHLSGDGHYSHLCHEWLLQKLGGVSARLTHSCTAALEMTAILADLAPGDEVILPSYTFVSTANAFVLRGAVPVFVDIRADTLNIDENLIEAAITPRTKAIVVVHYAGVCAEMDAILAIARRHGLMVIEDAAQALSSTYHGRRAGTFGELACFSFHETKNIVSGEGGALIINDPRLAERADIIREKGTNRIAFRKGAVDKYTWVDIGSSFLPGEITAAFLFAQFEEIERLNAERARMWERYHEAFRDLTDLASVRIPQAPAHCGHNHHMYYLILPSKLKRDNLIAGLASDGIMAPFHYVPLHSSPAGLKYARAHGDMSITDSISQRLLRLPLFSDLGEKQEFVIERVRARILDEQS